MFSLNFLIMTGSVLFLVGLFVGALISRKFVPTGNQKSLENNLQSARDELTKYQHDVAAHFAETSRLVHSLTESYKDVHDHLSKGAINLTNTEITEKMIAAGEASLGLEANDALKRQNHEAPKDWAPKTPGQKGTLSEDYGLDDFDEDKPASVHKGATA